MPGEGTGRRLGRRAVIGALGGLALPAVMRRARAAGAGRVGVILPGTGVTADRLARNGAEIAAELAARNGKPITLRFADPRAAEGGAGRAAATLIDGGADILLACCGEAGTSAALQLADRRAVPLISAHAGSSRLADRGSRMLVRTAPTISQLLGRGLGLVRDLGAATATRPPERLALLHLDDEAGEATRAALAAILPTASLPLRAYAEIAIGGAGGHGPEALAPALATLRHLRPDLILIETPPPVAATLIGAILAAGVHPNGIAAFGLPGLAATEVLDLPEGAGNGHLTLAPWPDPRAAVTAEVRSLFARRNPPERFEMVQGELGLVVDAVLLAGEAWRRQPDAQGHALAAALRGTVLARKMMRGPPMRFDARGQNTTLPSVALQNQGGRPIVILPRAIAEAAAVWPNPACAKG